VSKPPISVHCKTQFCPLKLEYCLVDTARPICLYACCKDGMHWCGDHCCGIDGVFGEAPAGCLWSHRRRSLRLVRIRTGTLTRAVSPGSSVCLQCDVNHYSSRGAATPSGCAQASTSVSTDPPAMNHQMSSCIWSTRPCRTLSLANTTRSRYDILLPARYVPNVAKRSI